MNDREIVQLFFDRNEAALSEVSQRYGRYCRAVAVNILGDHTEADECVNDTYLKHTAAASSVAWRVSEQDNKASCH